jgi:hypothetical protein
MIMGTISEACGQMAGNTPTIACTYQQRMSAHHACAHMCDPLSVEAEPNAALCLTMSVTPIASNIMIVGTRPAHATPAALVTCVLRLQKFAVCVGTAADNYGSAASQHQSPKTSPTRWATKDSGASTSGIAAITMFVVAGLSPTFSCSQNTMQSILQLARVEQHFTLAVILAATQILQGIYLEEDGEKFDSHAGRHAKHRV